MRLLIAVAATLVLSLVLAVEHPDQMLKPGRLSAGHLALEHDCLRCHTPMRGVAAASCLSCHRLAEIGRRTTAGAFLRAASGKVLFHASLANTDCLSCHALHTSARHRREVAFEHGFLAAAVRGDCGSCHLHERPADALHERLTVRCAACHATGAWRPATFDHGAAAPGSACASCHRQDRPDDAMHRQVQDNCGACHGTAAWRPATFDHDRYFRFDLDHPSDCRLCHAEGGSFTEYSCYGCHEHSPARISAEHREEGIRSFDDCARCHRSAEEGEAEGFEGGEDDDD